MLKIVEKLLPLFLRDAEKVSLLMRKRAISVRGSPGLLTGAEFIHLRDDILELSAELAKLILRNRDTCDSSRADDVLEQTFRGLQVLEIHTHEISGHLFFQILLLRGSFPDRRQPLEPVILQFRAFQFISGLRLVEAPALVVKMNLKDVSGMDTLGRLDGLGIALESFKIGLVLPVFDFELSLKGVGF